jgi:hypothetical protein
MKTAIVVWVGFLIGCGASPSNSEADLVDDGGTQVTRSNADAGIDAVKRGDVGRALVREGSTKEIGNAHDAASDLLDAGSVVASCSTAEDGTACAGPPCHELGCVTPNICHAGECVAGCYIGGTYQAPGAQDPLNACFLCLPLLGARVWSNSAQGSACGDGGTCGDSGQCVLASTCPLITSRGVTPSPGEVCLWAGIACGLIPETPCSDAGEFSCGDPSIVCPAIYAHENLCVRGQCLPVPQCDFDGGVAALFCPPGWMCDRTNAAPPYYCDLPCTDPSETVCTPAEP